MTKESIHSLNPSDISSDVFIIAPTQIDHIARVFADNVADAMNMRTFANKIRQIAAESLRGALTSAKKMGAGK